MEIFNNNKTYDFMGKKRQAIEDLKMAAKLGDKTATNILAEQKKWQDSLLKLVCHIEGYDKVMMVDLANNTVNGHSANVTESQIDWVQSDLRFSINRYSGQITSRLLKGGEPFFGKCIKASEKKF